jgi:adenylate kinase
MVDNLYIALGVNGVGKTSVIGKAVEGSEVKVIRFGDIITELLKKEDIIKNRDEIRAKVNQATWKEYQTKTALHIKKMVGSLVIDTHAALASPKGYFPGLPPHVLEYLPAPNILFLVEADPEQILARRNKDKNERTRDYDFESGLELITEHQEFNRMYAISYSALTGARVKIVRNDHGKLEDAAEIVRKALSFD